MKTYQNIFKNVLLLLLATISFINASFAQESKEDKKTDQQTTVENMISNKQYVFVASTVSPVGSRTRQLTSYYDVKVNGDSIISYLPFFGRAYSAPINGNGGIDFTATNFDYSVTLRKKAGWDIKIKFKDQPDVREMDFVIFENGRADLLVMSNNRQAISFSGLIKERE